MSTAPNSSNRVERQALVVLGMHRSGTSALTNVLALMGAELPRNLMPSSERNPRGYFESQSIFALHEEMIRDIGASWFDPSALLHDWAETAAAQSWVERLVAACREEFADARLIVLKDPRLCRIVSIWRRVWEALDTLPHYVIVIRNPLDVAASLERAQDIETTRALLLWLRHLLDAERDTRGAPRCFIAYDDLLEDWEGCVSRIEAELEIRLPGRSSRAKAKIDAFLSAELRHHCHTDADVDEWPDVSEWVRDAYAWTRHAATGVRVDCDALDRIHDEVDRADRAFGPLMRRAERAEARHARNVELLQKRVGDLDTSAIELRDAAERRESELGASRLRCEEFERELALVRAGLGASRLRCEEFERELALARAGLGASRLRCEEFERELALARAGLGASRLRCEEFERELTLIRAGLGASHLKCEEFERELALVQAGLGASHVRCEELERELALARAGLGASHVRCEELERELALARAGLSQSLEDLEAAGGEVDRLGEVLGQRLAQLTDTEARGVGLATELELARELLRHREFCVSRLQEELAAARLPGLRHSAVYMELLQGGLAALRRR